MFNLENPSWVYKLGFEFSTCEISRIEKYYLRLVWNPWNTIPFYVQCKILKLNLGLGNPNWVSLSWTCHKSHFWVWKWHSCACLHNTFVCKSHSACRNHTLGVKITLMRVEITLKRAGIKFVRVKIRLGRVFWKN
jgi:hypothetical protein